MQQNAPLILQVRISDTQTKILEIPDEEDPTEAIERFCRENGLSIDHQKMLLHGVMSAYKDDGPEAGNIEEDELEYEDYEVEQEVALPVNPTSQQMQSGSQTNSKGQMAVPKGSQNSKQFDPASMESRANINDEGMLRFEQQLSRKNLRVKFVESEQKEQIGKGMTFGQPNGQETVFESRGSKNYEIHINSPEKGIQRTNLNIDPNLSRITHENVRTENSEQFVPEKDQSAPAFPIPTFNPKNTINSAMPTLNARNDLGSDTGKLRPSESAYDSKDNRLYPKRQTSQSNLAIPGTLRHEPLIKPGRSITPEKPNDAPIDSSNVQKKLTENVC
jgi:hypothetical protein